MDAPARARPAAALLAVLAPAAAGCGPPPPSRIERDLAVVRAEETPEKLFARGRAYASIADHTRAEQYLAAAIDAGGDPREILPVLLRVCVAEKRYRVAIDYTERYLRKNPADHRMRLVLGTLFVNVADAEAAARELDRVIEEAPQLAGAHYARAVLARDAGDAVVADRHFREYLRLEPRGEHVAEAKGSLLKSVP
jgi:tetratricopeptide (TPR) repeat protein